jgi:hypothetical protein
MIQRFVRPQEQSLWATVHARQFQCSHQIHFRWFTSSQKRATIQSRICVRDTRPTYPGSPGTAMGRAAQHRRSAVLMGRSDPKTAPPELVRVA